MAGRQRLSMVSGNDRRGAVVDVELSFGDRLVMTRRRIGEYGAQFLVAGETFSGISDVLCLLKRISRGGDCFGHRAAFDFVAVKQHGRSMALADERQLPGEVEGVLQAAVHAVALRLR